jgi:hypothetical protein
MNNRSEEDITAFLRNRRTQLRLSWIPPPMVIVLRPAAADLPISPRSIPGSVAPCQLLLELLTHLAPFRRLNWVSVKSVIRYKLENARIGCNWAIYASCCMIKWLLATALSPRYFNFAPESS